MKLIREAHRKYHQHLSLERQVAFRALVSFLLLFGFLRVLTYVIHYQILPIRNIVTPSGFHIHLLFWGILLLMMVGFMALATRDPAWHLNIAIIFGIALALTLDEFALWLNPADVYWSPKGWESIQAGIAAAAVLAFIAVGTPFWRALARGVGLSSRQRKR
jgi:hypothetical protein